MKVDNKVRIVFTSDKIVKLNKAVPEKKSLRDKFVSILSEGLANLSSRVSVE